MKKRVLFVCTGNICRSPSAEGVFRAFVAQNPLPFELDIDSAATHSYHVGEHPDPRACAATKRRGVSIDQLIVRQVSLRDFTEFDFILAMDQGHMRILNELAPGNGQAEIKMFLSYAGDDGKEVPDPYYGSISDFEHMLDLIESGSQALHQHLANL